VKIEKYIVEHNLKDDVASEIADFIWWDDEKLDIKEKLYLTLQLFDQKPEYGVTMQLSINFDKMNKSIKDIMWNHYRSHLSNGDTLQSDQIKYSLWVDFFEDGETVEEAWNKMVGDYRDNIVLKQLLTISGPVPFKLKNDLYEKVIDNDEWHEYILDSLVGSFFDVYGKIDFHKARTILDKLKVDKTIEKYIQLNNCLKKFKSKIEYWESLEKTGANNSYRQ
jgi:hypothetical protein